MMFGIGDPIHAESSIRHARGTRIFVHVPKPLARFVSLVLLAACASNPHVAVDRHVAPDPATQIVVTAHPLATRTALAMLDRGGSPVDAAIAAQMVLGLVEPQSSGIGGGAIALYWDAASRKLTSFDGLAAAPSQVTAALDVDVDGSPLDRQAALRGGRAVGVPGALAMLRLAHARFGKLPWRDLFTPAIELAERGFALAPYEHDILVRETIARGNAAMRRLYFAADGAPFAAGTLLRNPEYARTLRTIADNSPERWLENGGAAAFVAAAQGGFRPSLMVEHDLLDYRAVEREPLCGAFLVYAVCTMGPPSHGGLIVLQMLQMAEARAAGFDFADASFVHVLAEASKIGQADRRRYLGDPAFVAVPARELASADYARRRAAEIGDVAQDRATPARAALAGAEEMTSQIVIADSQGSVLSLTTTINLNFGAGLMADGYVLNNAMNLFASAPRAGEFVPNRMEPRKRPTSAMAPTIAFDRDGQVVLAGGSAGGGPIPDYVAQSVIEMLANGRSPEEAIARGHLTSFARGKLQLEKGTPIAALVPALRAKGHDVEEVRLLSGLAFIKRERAGWIGAADPRRDGTAEQR